MKRYCQPLVLLIVLIILCIPVSAFSKSSAEGNLIRKARHRLREMGQILPGWTHVGRIRFDSLSLDQKDKQIQVFFTNPLSYVPVREHEVNLLEQGVRKRLGRRFRKYEIGLYTDHHLVQDLVPNYYRSSIPVDRKRISGDRSGRIPVVSRPGSEKLVSGLYNNNIALWDSHGWYYESKLDRWEWQRARLFGTVEDMSTMSFVLPYLVPMLENSGANVFLPRERDWQSQEVVVDNDTSTPGSELILPDDLTVERLSSGFLLKDTLISGENPFQMGSSLLIGSCKDKVIKYVPSFATRGRYSVSVSFHSDSLSSSGVKYSVFHTGGKSDFLVNQKIGGGTWIYLGTFDFDAGKNGETGMVTVSGNSDFHGVISLDGIKFGGGMGRVARRPSDETVPNKPSVAEGYGSALGSDKRNPRLFDYKLSGKPRYLEAARYYLQEAGFPDTLTYNLNQDKNDYNDDYQSRGQWVNYLMGKPNGPANHRDLPGLKIPVDLAFAFHTDAGITPDDSIVGTLGIYSTMADKGLFPNGTSRMSSRDLTDLIQSQLIGDIRQLFNPQWTCRGLWDKQYSEAWRPNVPAMLLELLSHQNIADMRFGLDPRFRFAVSRSIYKGMLKFQAFQENRQYMVHPLPVDHFTIVRLDKQTVKLSWSAVGDPLEPDAKPSEYKVYQRLEENGFDNGILVKDTTLILKLAEFDHIFSFKVTAINGGGESFPSETLSVGFKSQSKGDLLVVNAFDRICAPAIFDNGRQAGIAWWKDQGVADHQDISYVGSQFDFGRKSKWLDDDNPGWGSSYGDMEGKIIPGNSFDYPIVHGKAIMDAGYSFVSTSDEVFCKPDFDVLPYFAVDFILGEERSTPGLRDSGLTEFKIYTPEFISKILELTKKGGNLFLSGAYTGSEFGESKDSLTTDFAKNMLHFTWRTGHASRGGAFYATDYGHKWFDLKSNFNTGYHPGIYTVEAPDGIEPAGINAISAFRYGENNISAGVAFAGKYRVVAMGIPFETILEHKDRTRMMRQIIRFFESKETP